MGKLNWGHSFRVRCTAPLDRRVRSAEAWHKDLKWCGRILSAEGMCAAFVRYCLHYSEAEQRAILERELRAMEAELEGRDPDPPSNNPVAGTHPAKVLGPPITLPCVCPVDGDEAGEDKSGTVNKPVVKSNRPALGTRRRK